MICELISSLEANQIAGMASDFKMDIINELILPLSGKHSSTIRSAQLKNDFGQIIRRKFTNDLKIRNLLFT